MSSHTAVDPAQIDTHTHTHTHKVSRKNAGGMVLLYYNIICMYISTFMYNTFNRQKFCFAQNYMHKATNIPAR